MNETRANQRRVRAGNPSVGRSPAVPDPRGNLSAGPQKQPQSPSAFLGGYLQHVAEHGLDLDDLDSLFHYAGGTGQIVSPRYIASLQPYAYNGGVEHEVYSIPNVGAGRTIIKFTRAPNGRLGQRCYGLNPDAISYLTRFRKMNILAPRLDYKILGIMPRGTWPSIVTSMTHIHGTEPSGLELNHYMALTLGFKEEGGNSWLHPSGLAFGDVHTGNFVHTPDCRMVPIDVTLEGEPKLGTVEEYRSGIE